MLTSTSNLWSKKINSDKKSSLPTPATAKPNSPSMSENDPSLKSSKSMDKLMPFQLPTLKWKSINQNTKSTVLPSTLKTTHSLLITPSMKMRPLMIFTRQRSNLCYQVCSREVSWHVLHTVKLVPVRLSRWTDCRNWQLKSFTTLLKKVSVSWYHFFKSTEADAWIYWTRRQF